MKVFYSVDFTEHWPVSVSALAVAENEVEARELLDTVLHYDHKDAKLHGTNTTGFPGLDQTHSLGRDLRFNTPNPDGETDFSGHKRDSANPKVKQGKTPKSSAKFTFYSPQKDE